MINKFRKKPVTIEAVQWNGDNWDEIRDFCGVHQQGHGHGWYSADNKNYIGTLEGQMEASKGDYIIKGIKGEFYPCKPDIFEATYEKL